MDSKQADLLNRLEDLKKHQEEEEKLLRVSLFNMATKTEQELNIKQTFRLKGAISKLS